MGPPFWGDLGLEQSPCCSLWWLWMCSWPHCQGRGWRSQWEAAWDVLNCCKWDGACCALNHPVPPGWHCPGGLTTLGWHRVPSTRGHVPSARQGAPGMICGRDKELSASPGILGGMLQDHLVALAYVPVPHSSSQHHGRFSAPSPCRFSCQIIAHSPISGKQDRQAVPGTFSSSPLSSPQRGWGLWVLLGAVCGAGRG